MKSSPTPEDHDEEEFTEALRRRQEMMTDPDSIISWEQLQKAVERSNSPSVSIKASRQG